MVTAVIVPPIKTKPPANIVPTLLIFSPFFSTNACIKSILVTVNQPPAKNKKLSNKRDKTPWVFCPIFCTGVNNAFCIFASNALSFPSLNPCSANIASLFCFAISLCLSIWSLIAKLSFTPDNAVLRDVIWLVIDSNCLDTVVICRDCCCNKFVVTVSGCGCCWRCDAPRKLEEMFLLTALIPPAIGEPNSSITFLLCF